MTAFRTAKCSKTSAFIFERKLQNVFHVECVDIEQLNKSSIRYDFFKNINWESLQESWKDNFKWLLWGQRMKRRDSLASLFTGHSAKILSCEEEELLSDSEDVEERLSPSEESNQTSLVDDPSKISSTIVSHENPRNELKIMNLTKKINRKKGSPEIINSSASLSNLFSRVARLPKSPTTETECAIKQRRKLSSNAVQVRERPLILSFSQQKFDSLFNCSFCCHYQHRCCFGAFRREPGYVVCLFVCFELSVISGPGGFQRWYHKFTDLKNNQF